MAPTGGAGMAVMMVIADVGEQSCGCQVGHGIRQRRGQRTVRLGRCWLLG